MEKASRGAVGVAGVLCSTGRWRLNWEALCGIAGIVAGCLVLLAPFRVPIRKPDESGTVCYDAIQGPVAQWLEQQTHNLSVPGSSPGGSTRCTVLDLS